MLLKDYPLLASLLTNGQDEYGRSGSGKVNIKRLAAGKPAIRKTSSHSAQSSDVKKIIFDLHDLHQYISLHWEKIAGLLTALKQMDIPLYFATPEEERIVLSEEWPELPFHQAEWMGFYLGNIRDLAEKASKIIGHGSSDVISCSKQLSTDYPSAYIGDSAGIARLWAAFNHQKMPTLSKTTSQSELLALAPYESGHTDRELAHSQNYNLLAFNALKSLNSNRVQLNDTVQSHSGSTFTSETMVDLPLLMSAELYILDEDYTRTQIPAHELQTFLSHTPNLMHLTITRIDIISPKPHVHPAQVHHPSLKKLSLSPPNLKCILDHKLIDLSNLQSITIISKHRSDMIDEDQLIDDDYILKISEAAPHLEHLTFLTNGKVLEAFENMSSLKSLTFEYPIPINARFPARLEEIRSVHFEPIPNLSDMIDDIQEKYPHIKRLIDHDRCINLESEVPRDPVIRPSITIPTPPMAYPSSLPTVAPKANLAPITVSLPSPAVALTPEPTVEVEPFTELPSEAKSEPLVTNVKPAEAPVSREPTQEPTPKQSTHCKLHQYFKPALEGFPAIDPRMIREKVLLNIPEQQDRITTLNPKISRTLDEFFLLPASSTATQHYIGKGTFILQPGIPYFLPSISTKDYLERIHFSAHTDSITLQYHPERQQYSLLSQTACSVTTHWVIEKPTQETPSLITASFTSMIEAFNHRSPKPSCVDRCQEVLSTLQHSDYPQGVTDIRGVNSSGHAFIEIKHNGTWYPVDLGGISPDDPDNPYTLSQASEWGDAETPTPSSSSGAYETKGSDEIDPTSQVSTEATETINPSESPSRKPRRKRNKNTQQNQQSDSSGGQLSDMFKNMRPEAILAFLEALSQPLSIEDLEEPDPSQYDLAPIDVDPLAETYMYPASGHSFVSPPLSLPPMKNSLTLYHEETPEKSSIELPSLVGQLDARPLPKKKTHVELKSTLDLSALPSDRLLLIETVGADSKPSEGTLTHQKVIQTLMEQCAQAGNPVLYINQDMDLRLFGPYLNLQIDPENPLSAKVDYQDHTTPAGRLVHFLETYRDHHPRPTLILDLKYLSSEALIKCNRFLEEVSPYNHFQWILVGEKGKYYSGADLIRRIEGSVEYQEAAVTANRYQHWYSADNSSFSAHAFESKSFSSRESTLPAELKTSTDTTHAETQHHEELYFSSDWESLLLGKFQCLNEDIDYTYKKGGLIQKILTSPETPVHLVLNNPPKTPEFLAFLLEFNTHQRLLVNGQTLALPKGSTLTLTESPAQFQHLDRHTFERNDFESGRFIVDQDSLSELFEGTPISDNGQTLSMLNGIIEAHQNQTLKLFIAEELSVIAWEQLLNEAARFNCTLDVSIPAGIALPHPVEAKCSVTESRRETTSSPHRVIMAENPLFALQQNIHTSAEFQAKALTQKRVILLDNLELSDLKERIEVLSNVPPFQFKREHSDILTLLTTPPMSSEQNMTLVFAGNPRPEVARYLTSLILSNQVTLPNGHCTPIYPTIEWWVSPNEPMLLAVPEVQISRSKHISSQDTSHLGIAESKSDASSPTHFKEHRVANVKTALEASPVVILSGETGVGKSSFVARELPLAFEQKPIVHWISGEDSVAQMIHAIESAKKMALDASSRSTLSPSEMPTHVLVFDEGNISDPLHNPMDQLLPLLHPMCDTLILEGKCYDIRDIRASLKVVIMANPDSYGAHRQPSPLIQAARSVRFELLPFEYIHDEILAPLYDELKLPESLRETLMSQLASLYQAGCESITPGEEIPVTPRELSQILRMTAVDVHERILLRLDLPRLDQDDSILQRFNTILEHMRTTLLNASSRHSEEPSEPHHTFQNDRMVFDRTLESYPNIGNYTITPSRRRPLELLSTFVHLHQTAQASKAQASKAQALKAQASKAHDSNESSTMSASDKLHHAPHKGLHGMCLEGDSGTGKSQLVLEALHLMGFQEIPLDEVKLRNDEVMGKELSQIANGYLHIPADTDPDSRAYFFDMALKHGWIVLCDEFNSSYFDEKQLNHFLDRGLSLIITQNPSNDPKYPHRIPFSPAMARRFLHVSVAPYTSSEKKYIHEHSKNLLLDAVKSTLKVKKLSSLQEMILNNPTLFGVFGIDYEKLQASDSDQITRIRLMMALDQPLYEHLDRHIQTLLSHQNLLNQEGELKALSVQEVCQLITQARGNPSVPQTACGIADCSVRESIVVSTEQGKGF